MKKYRLKVILVLMLIGTMLFAFPTFADDETTCQHQWSNWVYMNGEGPTCGSSADAERHCELCGEVEVKTDPATGDHDWGFWETTRKATVFKKGKKVRECWECGESQTKSIAKLKPFAKFKKKTYSVTAGKTLALKGKVKMARGDKVKSWRVKGSAAKITKAGKVIAKKAGTVTVIATLKSGKKATCKVKIKAAKKKTSGGGIVYWVPNGSVYHLRRSCPTLSRSKTVYSGTRAQSGKSRCCKVCG